ncbi:MAG: ATP-binding protein [Puniceicoccaceae bacterium]
MRKQDTSIQDGRLVDSKGEALAWSIVERSENHQDVHLYLTNCLSVINEASLGFFLDAPLWLESLGAIEKDASEEEVRIAVEIESDLHLSLRAQPPAGFPVLPIPDQLPTPISRALRLGISSVLDRAELHWRTQMVEEAVSGDQSRPFEGVLRTLAEATNSVFAGIVVPAYHGKLEGLFFDSSSEGEGEEFTPYTIDKPPEEDCSGDRWLPPHRKLIGTGETNFLRIGLDIAGIGEGSLFVASRPSSYTCIESRLLSRTGDCLSLFAKAYRERSDSAHRLKMVHCEQTELFNSIPEIVLITDPKTGDIIFGNQAFYHRWSAVPKIGESRQIADPHALDGRHPLGEASTQTPSLNSSSWEFENLNDGRWYQCLDRLLVWHDEKTVRFQLAIDITERVAQRRRLHREIDLLETILDISAQGAWTYNIKTGHATYDARWKAMLGYSPEDELPNDISTWRNLCHPEDLPGALDKLRRHLNYGTPYEVELRMRHRDDFYVWIIARGRVVERSPEGEPIQMVGTHLDVSEQKQLQAELESARDLANEANSAKDEFIAVMSHEMRSPLNPIIGFTDLLKEELKSPEHLEYLRAISTASRRLQSLINDVLQYAKLTHASYQNEISDCCLRDLVSEVYEQMSGCTKGNQFVLEWSQTPGGEPEIHPDLIVRGFLNGAHQIMTNLLTNAFKFTEAGKVVLRAGVKSETADKLTFMVAVSDTGCGIAPSDIEKIFLPFEQAKFSLARRGEGVGLGLAIIKKILDAMGGKLEVESKVGVGSKFTVTIPLERLPLNL